MLHLRLLRRLLLLSCGCVPRHPGSGERNEDLYAFERAVISSGVGRGMVCEVSSSRDSSYRDDDHRDGDLHHLPVLQEGRFSHRLSDHLLRDLHLPSSDSLRVGPAEQGETDGRHHSCDAWSLHDGYRYGSFSSGVSVCLVTNAPSVYSSFFLLFSQQTKHI